ncbi:TPA: hypothetical protein QDB10_006173, partial [Burkholderia vietnamiensis]|nr:hypothetical protein [Burkholderia vietnamiensis]
MKNYPTGTAIVIYLCLETVFPSISRSASMPVTNPVTYSNDQKTATESAVCAGQYDNAMYQALANSAGVDQVAVDAMKGEIVKSANADANLVSGLAAITPASPSGAQAAAAAGEVSNSDVAINGILATFWQGSLAAEYAEVAIEGKQIALPQCDTEFAGTVTVKDGGINVTGNSLISGDLGVDGNGVFSGNVSTDGSFIAAGGAITVGGLSGVAQGISIGGGNISSVGNGGSAAKSSGVNAIAIGNGAVAGNDTSVALGTSATATSTSTTSIGSGAQATGASSSAVGQGSLAGAVAATAYGQGSDATGANSTAVGQGATASGIASTALGQGAEATGSDSTAVGQNAVANAVAATAVG